MVNCIKFAIYRLSFYSILIGTEHSIEHKWKISTVWDDLLKNYLDFIKHQLIASNILIIIVHKIELQKLEENPIINSFFFQAKETCDSINGCLFSIKKSLQKFKLDQDESCHPPQLVCRLCECKISPYIYMVNNI